MIDWILSLKSPEDSTDDLFNDFMTEQWDEKVTNTPKLTALQLQLINSGYDRTGLPSSLDN